MNNLANVIDEKGIKFNLTFDNSQLLSIGAGVFFAVILGSFLGVLLANKARV